jgi:hypothetical protein
VGSSIAQCSSADPRRLDHEEARREHPAPAGASKLKWFPVTTIAITR